MYVGGYNHVGEILHLENQWLHSCRWVCCIDSKLVCFCGRYKKGNHNIAPLWLRHCHVVLCNVHISVEHASAVTLCPELYLPSACVSGKDYNYTKRLYDHICSEILLHTTWLPQGHVQMTLSEVLHGLLPG